jgi:hypothetical protein
LHATLQIEGAEDVLDFQEVCSEADRNVPEGNGVDNEDSINLTIGEDEEKLLAEEVSSQSVVHLSLWSENLFMNTSR